MEIPLVGRPAPCRRAQYSKTLTIAEVRTKNTDAVIVGAGPIVDSNMMMPMLPWGCNKSRSRHARFLSNPKAVAFADQDVKTLPDIVRDQPSASAVNDEVGCCTQFGVHAGMSSDGIARIRAHIMATQQVALPADDDCGLVADIDLAILGAIPSRHDEFERDVRTEYRWVPGIVYRPKRAAILQSFPDRLGSIIGHRCTSALSATPGQTCPGLSER